MTFYFLFDLFLHLISDPLALTSPRAARFRGPGRRSASSDPWKGAAFHQGWPDGETQSWNRWDFQFFLQDSSKHH